MTHPRPPRLRLGLLDYIGWRFSLVDDAGAQHQLDSRAMWLGWRRKGRTRDQLRVPRREIMPSFWSICVYMGVFTVLLAPIVTASTRSAWPPMLDLIARVVISTVATTASFMFIGARFRRRTLRYVGLMKRRALCPACIHSLTGLNVPEDGLVTCPECGARWRFDPETGRERGGSNN